MDQFLKYISSLRPFNGHGSFTLQEFLNAIEKVVQLGRHNEGLLAYSLNVIINDKIQGEAKKCIQRLGPNINNWNKVEAELNRHFRPRRNYVDLLNEARQLNGKYTSRTF